MKPQPLPLALTMGEPAGVGGEIALLAWLRRAEDVPPFYLIDDPERLATIAHRLGWDVPVIALRDVFETAAVFAQALPVLRSAAASGPNRAAPTRPTRCW